MTGPVGASDPDAELFEMIRANPFGTVEFAAVIQSLLDRAAELAEIRALFDNGDLDDTEGFAPPTTLECVRNLMADYRAAPSFGGDDDTRG